VLSKAELEAMPYEGGREKDEEPQARKQKAGTSAEEDWHTTPI